MSTADFYNNKTILLTGATGFVGKAILEKILRMLEVRVVYVLIRGKMGKNLQERFIKEVINSKCFDRLRQIKGADFDQFIKRTVVPVDGDLLKTGLGLSPEIRNELIENVNVIINSAASVDFNSPIRQALDINFFGCQRVLHLAKECKYLENFVHISTAYVNSDKFGYIDERIYNPQNDVEQYVHNLYRESSQVTEKVLIGNFPNTYTFTKNLAEQMLMQQRPVEMTISIVRPTIVGAALRDPVPGWVDNLVGGAAVIFFAGIGVTQIYTGNDALISDQVPVDFVVDQTIVVGAHQANKAELQIYHCGTSARNPAFQKITKETCREYWNKNVPAVRVEQCNIKTNENEFHYWAIRTKRLMMAKLLKIQALSTGNKEGLKKAEKYVRVIQRADMINNTFRYFNTHEWIFSQDNTQQLMKCLDKYEQDIYLLDVTIIDWRQYLLTFNYGLQKYFLNENVDIPVEEVSGDLLSSWKTTVFLDPQTITKSPLQDRHVQSRPRL